MQKFLWASMLIFATTLSGLSQIKEASITYQVTDVESDNEHVKSMIDMMKGSTLEVYFKGDQQRVDIDMMGGMMKMSTFTGQSGDAPNILFMEMMGQKMKIPMNDEQLKQYQGEKKQEDTQQMAIEEFKSDTKDILGYTCYKTVLTNPDDKDMKLIAWVTDKIESPSNVIQNASGDVRLNGFPLAYTIAHPQMSMTYEATQLEKNVDANAFTHPEGFREMSFDEFINNMGALGGMGH